MTVDELSPNVTERLSPRSADTEIRILTAARVELDAAYRMMQKFHGLPDPGEIFMQLAAFSARASEIRGHVVRQETKRMQAFRTRELDPFIDECDRQFRLWSRVQSVRQLEADLTRGGYT